MNADFVSAVDLDKPRRLATVYCFIVNVLTICLGNIELIINI